MDSPLVIPIRRLNDKAEFPVYAHIGDAGADLCSIVDTDVAPLSRAIIPCGFALAIPQGYAGLVMPRSGLALKSGITVLNAPGLIDSGYRGEISVVLFNSDTNDSFHISKGDRIAQLVITSIPPIMFKEVDSLDDTNRGAQGFGSSGV